VNSGQSIRSPLVGEGRQLHPCGLEPGHDVVFVGDLLHVAHDQGGTQKVSVVNDCGLIRPRLSLLCNFGVCAETSSVIEFWVSKVWQLLIMQPVWGVCHSNKDVVETEPTRR
jgi:hypothetical protein